MSKLKFSKYIKIWSEAKEVQITPHFDQCEN